MTTIVTKAGVVRARHMGRGPELVDRLNAWVSEGIITEAQARRIEAHESRSGHPAGDPARPSLLPEALGYLGGVVVLVAAALLAGQLWADLTLVSRLLLVGTAAAALLTAGAAVPKRAGQAGRRLRGVLWAGAVLAWAGFLGVVAADGWAMSENHAALVTTLGAAVPAIVLWLRSPTLAQHLVAILTVAAAAATTVVQVDDTGRLPGLGVWAVGIVWLVLSWGQVIRPARAGMALGLTAAVLGGWLSMSTDAGSGLALLTATGAIAVGLLLRDLLLVAIGALGLLLALPTAVARWFDGSVAAPLALLGAGVLLIVGALSIARGHEDREHRSRVPHAVESPLVAIALSAAVVVVILMVVGVVAS
ncbi:MULTISPECIES: DUF2157 domain-containing protein [Nocardioides]|uniref:DUF2157 domain-containing protein n=1 Tax=Nocardioides vastitatis TaxID=2568655 RepID=A0ABW0ZMR3_9ACTN|nr:DUF2157 domain-containing protein [Nocardioides sp.]THJ06224.1 DUF2157 domain-containing protein [Nocardioides sp.]